MEVKDIVFNLREDDQDKASIPNSAPFESPRVPEAAKPPKEPDALIEVDYKLRDDIIEAAAQYDIMRASLPPLLKNTTNPVTPA